MCITSLGIELDWLPANLDDWSKLTIGPNSVFAPTEDWLLELDPLNPFPLDANPAPEAWLRASFPKEFEKLWPLEKIWSLGKEDANPDPWPKAEDTPWSPNDPAEFGFREPPVEKPCPKRFPDELDDDATDEEDDTPWAWNPAEKLDEWLLDWLPVTEFLKK